MSWRLKSALKSDGQGETTSFKIGQNFTGDGGFMQLPFQQRIRFEKCMMNWCKVDNESYKMHYTNASQIVTISELYVRRKVDKRCES